VAAQVVGVAVLGEIVAAVATAVIVGVVATARVDKAIQAQIIHRFGPFSWQVL
jgi:hypothetical protein